MLAGELRFWPGGWLRHPSQTHPLPRHLAHTICIAFSKIYHPLDLHTREILAIVVAAVAVDGEITAKFGDGVSTYRVGLKVEAGS